MHALFLPTLLRNYLIAKIILWGDLRLKPTALPGVIEP
jgi:hypothetical protein